MKPSYLSLILTVLLLMAGEAESQKPVDAEASETRFSLLEGDKGLAINLDGKPFAKYDLYSANKPYVWSVIGPTGKLMTRSFPMVDSKLEKKNQRDHPHHRGILFGHESIGRDSWRDPESDESWNQMLAVNRAAIGGDTWHEAMTFEVNQKSPKRSENGLRKRAMLAKIKHREFKTLDANDDRAIVVQICDYLDRDGRKFLEEERTLTFRASSVARSIDFEQTFTASDGDVVFHDRKDAGLAIRVPASMAVESKLGGQIVNSAGKEDGDAWSKPAKWCDYHGPVEGEHLGIAILNHPTSYRFPTRWHVRQYGLFAANPFGSRAFSSKLDDATTKLKRGDRLELKHRFIFHLGNAADAKIEEAWQQYCKE